MSDVKLSYSTHSRIISIEKDVHRIYGKGVREDKNIWTYKDLWPLTDLSAYLWM